MNVSERWVFLFILLNIFFFQGLNRIGFGALLDVNFRLVDNQRIFLDELNEVKEAINIEDVALLTITAYSATKKQCDSDPNMTASMRPPKPGTIAVSRDLFKDGWVFGKKVYIEGKGIFEVNDLMNARLKKQIDIFMPTTKMALNFGKKELHAMLLKIQKGKIIMQKVLALIDAQNLWYTPKNDWNKKLDYKKLYSLLKKEHPDQEIEPYIYLILDPLVSSDAFISLLRCIGYVPRIKFIFQSDDKEFSNTDWSTDMVREGRNLIKDADYTSVLVASGNCAFIDLFNYAGMLGKTTNLFCFEKDYSEKFSQKVDKITFLDKNVCFQK